MSTVTGAFYKMYYTTPLNPKKSNTWTSRTKNLEIWEKTWRFINGVKKN